MSRHNPRNLPVRAPRLWVLAIFLAFWAAVAYWAYTPQDNLNDWWGSIFWTAPVGVTVIGLYGTWVSRPIIKNQPTSAPRITTPLDVIITTKGTQQVIGALVRVIRSTTAFSNYFLDYRVQIVTDEEGDAIAEIQAVAATVRNVEVLVVPSSYQTPNGARFKTRSSHFALMARLEERDGTTPSKHFTYYLDDDTAVNADTVLGLAAFIATNNSGTDTDKHLAQGVLVYDRERSESRLTWMADSIRPFDDVARFPATTGTGNPIAGLHGENLLIRTVIDVELGWDFAHETVEDSRKALTFATQYPDKSAWITSRCYGSSPVNSQQLVTQRKRWAAGMMGLALNRAFPLRQRALILHNMIIWAFGICQPAAVVFILSIMIGDYSVSPVIPELAPLWVLSAGYTYWGYWEGLRMNAQASGMRGPRLIDKLTLLPLIFYFSILEGLGGTLGVIKHFREGTNKKFELVDKRL